MLPIKIKRQLTSGFTLIEMIVVITLLGLVSVIASGFLLTSMIAGSKAEITKEVRQSGAYALSVMEGLIINAATVTCSDDFKTITTIDLNGYQNLFVCDENAGKIASNTATLQTDLTNTNVKISTCQFQCSGGSGKPTQVDIQFRVSQKDSTATRSEEKASIDFKIVVATKNH